MSPCIIIQWQFRQASGLIEFSSASTAVDWADKSLTICPEMTIYAIVWEV